MATPPRPGGDRVLVVGAGISGIACARVLAEAGRDVLVLDRGRRAGGRMAVRTWDGRPTDIGASYLTAAAPEFAAVVQQWHSDGLARPWTDTFSVVGPEGERTSTGPVRWAAPGGLRSLVESYVADLPLQLEHAVAAVRPGPDGWQVDGERAAAVVLAMPDPQGRRLLPAGSPVAARLDDDFEPVLVLTTRWPERSWPDRDGIFVHADDVLSFVADDGLRRGDRAPVVVAHSTPQFARQHLQLPAEAAPAMLAALRRVLALGDAVQPVLADVHRWSFARPGRGHPEPYLLTEDLLGVCGDAWSDKPRVEAAFLSGQRLGHALLARLG